MKNVDRTLNRTLDRTRSRMDLRVRSARLGFVTGCWSGLTSASDQFTCAQEEERTTGASGSSRNRSIRSGVQRGRAQRSADRTHDASGHVRSDASGRSGSLLDSDLTPGAVRPFKR
jgi:hypothetical protein